MRTPFSPRLGKASQQTLQRAPVVVLTILGTQLTGCAVVRGIFEAGLWVGIVIALFAIVGVLGIMRTFSRR
jgi:hypothetical protein